MARAYSQFLRIFDSANTYQAWQSYYVNVSVTWENLSWMYQPFEFDGITTGEIQSESSISLSLPATTNVIQVVLQGLESAHLAELRVYEFDTLDGNSMPQAEQQLVSSFVGEIVGVAATLTTVKLELGSSLSPVGAHVPSRTFISELIGAPCQL